MIRSSGAHETRLIKLLHDQAVEAGIPLKPSDNLYGLAYNTLSNHAVGKRLLKGERVGGLTFTEFVNIIIEQLIVAKEKKNPKDFTKKYVLDSIVPNVVNSMKEDGASLAKVKAYKNLQKLMEMHSVSPDFIDKSYKGEKKSLKEAEKHNKEWLDSIFDGGKLPTVFTSFLSGKDGNDPNRVAFFAYWNKSLKNKANDYYDSIKKFEKFDESASFGNTDRDNDEKGVFSESSIGSDEVNTKFEDQMTKKEMQKQLSSIDPRYEGILDAIASGKDIKKALGSDSTKLLQKFMVDMKKVVNKLDLNQDEALRVIRAKKRAKIASSIILRMLNAGLL